MPSSSLPGVPEPLITLEEDTLLLGELGKRQTRDKEAPCRMVEAPWKEDSLPLLDLLPARPAPPSSPARYSSPHHPPLDLVQTPQLCDAPTIRGAAVPNPPPSPTHSDISTVTSGEFVVIDIGGEKFRARRSLFLAFPTTRLGQLMAVSEVSDILEFCEEFTPGPSPEFFFDRNPETFGGILEMYRCGSFHLPEGSRNCAFVLQRDIKYWGLDELDLEACCALKYYPEIEVCSKQAQGDREQADKEQLEEQEVGFGPGRVARMRSVLWDLLERPWTSKLAGYYAIFSLSMVFVSTATFVMSTAEELQEDVQFLEVVDKIDVACVVFFTFEYFIRFIVAQKKVRFFVDKLNLMDFICLIPFFTSLILEELEDFEIIGKAGKIIRLMKVLRIFRVYKLFKHFAGLQSLLYTLGEAYKELGLLLHIIGQSAAELAA